MGLRRAVRSGSAWYPDSVRERGQELPAAGASGLAVVVFMGLACLREPGQHIGKIPDAPLIPVAGIGGKSGMVWGQGLARAGLYPPKAAPNELIGTPRGDSARNGASRGRFLRPGDVMQGTITGLGRQATGA